MIELKKNFTKKGIEYTLKVKTDKVVIYELHKKTDNGKHIRWYEVLKYRIHKPDKYHSDEYEQYGSDEECGTFFWSCSNIKVVKKVLKQHFPDVNASEIFHIWYAVLRN